MPQSNPPTLPVTKANLGILNQELSLEMNFRLNPWTPNDSAAQAPQAEIR